MVKSKTATLALFVLLPFLTQAQLIGHSEKEYATDNPADTDGRIHLHVDIKPLYAECDQPNVFTLEKQFCTYDKIKSFVQNNLQYPEDAKSKGISGRVNLWAVVEVDGTVSDARVKKSDAEELNEEAVRVVSSLPPLVPAKLKEKTVRSFLEVTVDFKLPNQ